jgi:hypothetical protein
MESEKNGEMEQLQYAITAHVTYPLRLHLHDTISLSSYSLSTGAILMRAPVGLHPCQLREGG